MDLMSIKDRYELIPTRKIEIDIHTDLVAFKAQGINYKILKFTILGFEYKIETLQIKNTQSKFH
jgi:hypothetical protein